MDPVIHSCDFGRVVNLQSERWLTDDNFFNLLKHHFVPDKKYNFPVYKFGINCLEEHNGITYLLCN